MRVLILGGSVNRLVNMYIYSDILVEHFCEFVLFDYLFWNYVYWDLHILLCLHWCSQVDVIYIDVG